MHSFPRVFGSLFLKAPVPCKTASKYYAFLLLNSVTGMLAMTLMADEEMYPPCLFLHYNT
jgi:hypothetical protein